MTDILFPVHSGLDDDNIDIDTNFGDPSEPSLDPLTQLETPPSQSIPSMPIPFLTSHHNADPASLANITDDATTNKIWTEYHPRSNRPAKVGHINLAYGASTQCECPTLAPWWPFFRMWEDFLVVEILLESHLAWDKLDKLIKIIDSCVNGKGLFTLKGISDVEGAWDQASLKLAPMS